MKKSNVNLAGEKDVAVYEERCCPLLSEKYRSLDHLTSLDGGSRSVRAGSG